MSGRMLNSECVRNVNQGGFHLRTPCSAVRVLPELAVAWRAKGHFSPPPSVQTRTRRVPLDC
jgi:hypothetical protein